MNQGKLEVLKQEMTRLNIDILGIIELKWTEMGEFNSDDHYIYYCGPEFLRRNGGATIVNKRVQNAVLGCSLKDDRMISFRFQEKPFNIMVIQVYALTSNAEEAEVERFYEAPARLSRTNNNNKKKLSFSLQRTGMKKYEVKRYMEQQECLEYKMECDMKQDKS